MSPRDCPKFLGCSAPLCPLDPDWRLRVMYPSERACFYLLEAVKDGAAARFEGVQGEAIYLQATQALPEMVATSTTLRKAVERAALTGSRVGRGFPSRKGEA